MGQLASALENLVANATQFADPGTTVRIAVEHRPTAVRITVANHGPGLSPAARARGTGSRRSRYTVSMSCLPTQDGCTQSLILFSHGQAS
jgi:anti-sigma regulatory factor (Ser/Thr protein kinase)